MVEFYHTEQFRYFNSVEMQDKYEKAAMFYQKNPQILPHTSQGIMRIKKEHFATC